MALKQMYATTGRKFDPNYVSIINSQTPYLLPMKQQEGMREQQEKENELANRGLALREKEMLTNEQLAREEMEQNQKQTKRANAIALGNLGLRGGLAAYENIDPVKNVVDKAIGGVKGLFTETPTPSGAESYLGDAFETGGATNWMENLGTWESILQPTGEKLVSGMGSVLDFGGFEDLGGDVYTGAVESMLDFSDFDWSDWDLF